MSDSPLAIPTMIDRYATEYPHDFHADTHTNHGLGALMSEVEALAELFTEFDAEAAQSAAMVADHIADIGGRE